MQVFVTCRNPTCSGFKFECKLSFIVERHDENTFPQQNPRDLFWCGCKNYLHKRALGMKSFGYVLVLSRLNKWCKKWNSTLQLTGYWNVEDSQVVPACCSRIVTLKILNSSPCFGVDRHLLYGFSFHHELGSFRGWKFLPPISYGTRTCELSPLAKLWGW